MFFVFFVVVFLLGLLVFLHPFILLDLQTRIQLLTFFLEGFSDDTRDDVQTVDIIVAHGTDKHKFALPISSQVASLHEEIERATGVPQNAQKLLFKGASKINNSQMNEYNVNVFFILYYYYFTHCFRNLFLNVCLLQEKPLQIQSRP